MHEPLKNCPFCGEAAKHSFNSLYGDMSMASCKSCGATAYAPKWNRRAVLAKWGQPAQAGEYPALVCDYCGALTPDPWHSSGMLHGKMSKHIHSCDACAARGAAQPQAGAVPLTDEQIKALMQAHRTAMLMTCKARVPECGEFAAIAQDLDWLCESFGIKGGQHVE